MQQPHLMHTHLNLKMCVSACEVSESKLRDTDKLAVLLFFFFLINSINIITSALFTPFFVGKKRDGHTGARMHAPDIHAVSRGQCKWRRGRWLEDTSSPIYAARPFALANQDQSFLEVNDQ